MREVEPRCHSAAATGEAGLEVARQPADVAALLDPHRSRLVDPRVAPGAVDRRDPEVHVRQLVLERSDAGAIATARRRSRHA